jgi:hypothetical protein
MARLDLPTVRLFLCLSGIDRNVPNLSTVEAHRGPINPRSDFPRVLRSAVQIDFFHGGYQVINPLVSEWVTDDPVVSETPAR